MISLIVAMTPNGVIGNGGKTPWDCPVDMERFKSLTMGKIVVMGHKTFKEIGKPLRGRHNVVLTREMPTDKVRMEQGIAWMGSLDPVLAQSAFTEVFVIGGAQVYALAMPSVEKIYLTKLREEIPGDVRFPCEISPQDWRVDYYEDVETNKFPHEFSILSRCNK